MASAGTDDSSGSPDDHRAVAVGALVAAQGLDLATTLHGLRSAGVVERNPLAVAAMARFGRLPGLLCLTLVGLLAAVVVTELTVRRYGDAFLGPARVRWVGYAPLVLLSTAAALNNLLVSGAV